MTITISCSSLNAKGTVTKFSTFLRAVFIHDQKGDPMKSKCLPIITASIFSIILMSLLGCPQILLETAKKAHESRTTQDQLLDAKINAGILSRLSDKDKGLLLDLNVDVWEQRVMLTGTLDDPQVKREVVNLVNLDDRVRVVYDEIQIVTKAEKEARRKQTETNQERSKEGVGQAVDDFWIATKIELQLIGQKGITSVNYRWRSVKNMVYIIGEASDATELNAVLDIIKNTKGVEGVKHFIEVPPSAA